MDKTKITFLALAPVFLVAAWFCLSETEGYSRSTPYSSTMGKLAWVFVVAAIVFLYRGLTTPPKE